MSDRCNFGNLRQLFLIPVLELFLIFAVLDLLNFSLHDLEPRHADHYFLEYLGIVALGLQVLSNCLVLLNKILEHVDVLLNIYCALLAGELEPLLGLNQVAVELFDP